jgi:hypothetical protein
MPNSSSSPPIPSSSSSTSSPQGLESTNGSNVNLNIDDKECRQHLYAGRILKLRNFDDAFELVKLAVEEKFKMHRAGLCLVLQGLPGNLGAYHVLGSNMIILNKRILSLIKGIKSAEQYNSFLFMVLTHEYLHSFGITNEFRVRTMTYEVCRSLLGEGHSATIMARYEPWSVIPELGAIQNNFDGTFELIRDFDKRSHSYIA